MEWNDGLDGWLGHHGNGDDRRWGQKGLVRRECELYFDLCIVQLAGSA